ncbi:hypothetical protein J2W24_005528 [Variovorax boronicumulans]|uniref:hypothetical protein n=1 Tax=Variovorax boronicumulans TaxID=436515 RepID=UPI0027841047|nr:hypothetical protein [Variovorax boronicumulans]MDP9919848.1 hypothetical protein [Variovorax boronicumulans]
MAWARALNPWLTCRLRLRVSPSHVIRQKPLSADIAACRRKQADTYHLSFNLMSVSLMPTSWIESESKVLARAIRCHRTLSHLVHFGLDGAFPFPEHPYGQDVLVAINVLRQRLGLSVDGRPGDVDLLVVPTRDSPMADRAIAIEIKIVRPTMAKPSRNANAMGASQAIGLFEDGFPFAGLVHICIPSPLPPELHLSVPKALNKLGPDGKLLYSGEFFSFDPFPLLSAQRQLGRIAALQLPEEVGYNVLGVNLSKDGQRFAGHTLGDERKAVRNPRSSPDLIEAIRRLCVENPDLFRRVCWNDGGG